MNEKLFESIYAMNLSESFEPIEDAIIADGALGVDDDYGLGYNEPDSDYEDYEDCDDEYVDENGCDAGGHYVGAEDDAFVADFLRDQVWDDRFTESALKEDMKDAAWGEGYKAVKRDERESVRTPNPYEPGSDLYRYWQNGYKAGEEDLQGGYYNESKESTFEAVLNEAAGPHAADPVDELEKKYGVIVEKGDGEFSVEEYGKSEIDYSVYVKGATDEVVSPTTGEPADGYCADIRATAKTPKISLLSGKGEPTYAEYGSAWARIDDGSWCDGVELGELPESDIKIQFFWNDYTRPFKRTEITADQFKEIKRLTDEQLEAIIGTIKKIFVHDIEEYVSENPEDFANEPDDYDAFYESVLRECDGGCAGGDCSGACDGAVTASDFTGQVPENMGAVVGPGKDDKKFSDVFGD